ncbi:MAG: hypothetical protein HFI40_13125 [Lachnospiraceae bacterium]|nr:hypothetical protein [Lachnospiraceae bacterium]MCX4317006.1 hypothetical protein [Lachnospiraceae bacterium]
MANHVFQTTPERDYYLLENQDGKTTEVNEETIGDYLEELFDDPEQFVTLTPPKSQNGIRFIQACLDKNKNEGNYVEVELGMEEADGIHLLYKMCTEEECVRIFYDFYDDLFQPVLADYQPVSF